ncbi:lysis protein [Pseudomonas sp. WS 5078]|nr:MULTISPECIES: lysis system i-spanin subunit Rz [unclassified Pseudomonas]NMY36218.1 lysis protein [Pseudomonas sp. WS 5078]NMY58959.1 lysis protein [Pseudomonas sp. WS 5354]
MLCLMAGSAWAAWEWQSNAYGQQIAEQKAAHQTALTDVANANSVLILAEQNKRFALEQWLAASDQAHYRALTDAKNNQDRLLDRIATTELRLSVLLDTTAANGSDGMQTATATGCVVHGATRARLDRAHAQRIIGIIGDGDQGLIALKACQAYAQEISAAK